MDARIITSCSAPIWYLGNIIVSGYLLGIFAWRAFRIKEIGKKISPFYFYNMWILAAIFITNIISGGASYYRIKGLFISGDSKTLVLETYMDILNSWWFNSRQMIVFFALLYIAIHISARLKYGKIKIDEIKDSD